MPRRPKTPPPTAPASADLATLTQWFGADRWDKLEKQAAIVRGWTGDEFRAVATGSLATFALGFAPAQAVHRAALHLLRALGSAPTPADLARVP